MKKNATNSKMPIGGYFGPYRQSVEPTEYHKAKTYDYITEDIFSKIKEMGINLIVSCNNDFANENERQQIIDGLVLAEKYGIDMLVKDGRLDKVEDVPQLAEYLKDYAQYSSFKGINIIDEPFTEYFGSAYYAENIRRLEWYIPKSILLNQKSNIFGYMNLNGMGNHLAPEEQLEELYERYLEEYITSCKPRMLSWDYYVFDEKIYGNKTYANTKGYFTNLGMMREKSLKYGIPFWSYIQAGSNWNDTVADSGTWETDNTHPTKGELLWNVNTALAYGAKGIQYFPMIQPFFFAYGGINGNIDDFERNGLIAADGSETKWYFYAQEANKWIRKIEYILMNASSQKVLAIGDNVQSDTRITGETSCGSLKLITAPDGAVVGAFIYEGKQVYYVVNYDTEKSQMITLHFDETKDICAFTQGIEKTLSTNNDEVSFTVEAGNAVLVMVE